MIVSIGLRRGNRMAIQGQAERRTDTIHTEGQSSVYMFATEKLKCCQYTIASQTSRPRVWIFEQESGGEKQ